MENALVEVITSILLKLAVTAIGVLGAWLIAQINKTEKLKTIGQAIEELTKAAQTTVLELQQTVVDGWKEASADGKLSPEEIEELGKRLLAMTIEKMSDPSIKVLRAANVDVNAIIQGIGEALIAKIHGEEKAVDKVTAPAQAAIDLAVKEAPTED